MHGRAGYVVLGLVLLLALVGVLLLAARWFSSHRAAIVSGVRRVWRGFISSRPMQHLRKRFPRAWRFIAARFARGEYLGLHFTIALVICLAALWTFAGIAEDVVHKDPLTVFDLSVLEWLRARRTPEMYSIARAISGFGSSYMLALLGLSGVIVLVVKRQAVMLEGWVIALVGGSVLNQALKRIIERPRPEHSTIVASWSFPSGHAMEALIGYGMLVYVLIVLFPRVHARHAWVIGAAVLLVLAIGFTRLYLGVHYFSDVIAGYAAGAVWLSACISGLEITRRWKAPHDDSPRG